MGEIFRTIRTRFGNFSSLVDLSNVRRFCLDNAIRVARKVQPAGVGQVAVLVFLDLEEPVEPSPAEDFTNFGAQAEQHQSGVFLLQSPLEDNQPAQGFTTEEFDVGTIDHQRLAIPAVGNGVPLVGQLRELLSAKEPAIQKADS